MAATDNCPVCGSKTISGGQFNTDSLVAWQPIHCEACGSSWEDTYKLIDVDTAFDRDGNEINICD